MPAPVLRTLYIITQRGYFIPCYRWEDRLNNTLRNTCILTQKFRYLNATLHSKWETEMLTGTRRWRKWVMQVQCKTRGLMMPMEKRQPFCVPYKDLILICFVLFFLILKTFASQRQIEHSLPVDSLPMRGWSSRALWKIRPRKPALFCFSSEKNVDGFQLTPASTMERETGDNAQRAYPFSVFCSDFPFPGASCKKKKKKEKKFKNPL